MIDLHKKDTERDTIEMKCVYITRKKKLNYWILEKKLSVVVGRCTAINAAISSSLFPWTSLLLLMMMIAIGSTI